MAMYRIKFLRLSSGERLPVILDSLGQPLFGPTVYSLTEVRGRNRASKTIESVLRSLLVLFLFLDLRQIPLENRLASGQTLALGEIEDLVRFCRLPMENIQGLFDVVDRKLLPFKSMSSEKHRSRLGKGFEKENLPATAATRLRYIRDYLCWMIDERVSKHGVAATYRSDLDSSRQILVSGIGSRLPSGDNRGSLNQREGLDPEIATEILRVVAPHSAANPWQDEHSRYRNHLAIQWLYYLGLRRGELLNVRISDINFRKGTVVIARRADDPNDPRVYQPNVKTRAREVPLSTGLSDITSSYIMNQRAAIKGARKHDFLLVASDTGAPLSIPSLEKVFTVLRTKCPDLPRNLSSHVLRHTWNDSYSEEMDRNRVPEETEKKTRSYLMGWSETSGTAAIYTRRHIRRKAQKAALEMQNSMAGRDKSDD